MAKDDQEAGYLEWIKGIYIGSREQGDSLPKGLATTTLAAAAGGVHRTYRAANDATSSVTDQLTEDKQDLDEMEGTLESND